MLIKYLKTVILLSFLSASSCKKNDDISQSSEGDAESPTSPISPQTQQRTSQSPSLATINLNSIPDFTIHESELFSYQLEVSIYNIKTPVSFLCEINGNVCPENLSFSSGGKIIWQTNYNSSGIYNFKLTAFAGSPSSSQSFTLVIENVNRIPSITIADLQAPFEILEVGDSKNITFNGADPDNIANINLYFSTSTDICSLPIDPSWTLIASILSLSSTNYNWIVSEPGLIYICAVINDGEAQAFIQAKGSILVLPENKTLWLKADAGITAEANKISKWIDQSGNGFNASQPIVSLQPLIENNTLNGYPGIKFDGIDDHFIDSHIYSGKTVFSALIIDSVTQENTDLAGIWGSYDDGIHVAIDGRTPGNFSFDGVGTGSARYSIGMNPLESNFIANGVTTAWSYGALQIITTEFQTTTEITEQAIGSLSSSPTLSSHRFGGKLFELIIYDRVLTGKEIQTVQFYLNYKWNENITTTPPNEIINLIGNSFDSSTITLNWDSGRGSTTAFSLSYAIGVTAPESCNTGIKINSNLVGNNTSYGITNLSPSTQYSFRVCAVNTSSIPSSTSTGEIISFTTIDSDPTPPETSLVLWLSAERLTTLGENNVVTEWGDNTPNNFHAIQNSIDSQPILVANQLAGKPVIHFDGINDYLQGIHTYTSRTTFIVFRLSSAIQNINHLAQLWGQYGGEAHVAVDPRTGSNQAGFSFDGNTSESAIYALDSNSYTMSAYTNGNIQTWSYDTFHIVSTEFSNDLNITNYCIGFLCSSFSLGSHHLGGDIAEILIYDSVLDNTTKTEVESYLSSKWNL